MSYHPPDLDFVDSGTITTNAVAGNTVVTNILAAPGAGVRYRIWAIVAVALQTSASGARFDLRHTYTSGTIFQFARSGFVAGQQAESVQIYPGGINLPDNQEFDCRSNCSSASQEFALMVYYTTEDSPT